MNSGLIRSLRVAVLVLGFTTAALGQTQEPPKEESAGAAAKKTNTKKRKTEPGKVYSEDDLARLPDGGLSVVGQQPAPADDAAKVKGADGKAEAGKSSRDKGDTGKGDKTEEPKQKDEWYWRKRAQKILEPLEAVNEEIGRVQVEMKKPKPTKPDANKDDPNGLAVANDPKTRLQELERQKADLEKQLDSLEEEGRRAGAPSVWFR